VKRWVTRNDERRLAALGGHGEEGLEEPLEVLVRALGRNREDDRLVPEAEPPAKLVLGDRVGLWERRPEVGHVHPLRGDVQEADDVVLSGLREGEHATRTAGRERNEQAHPASEYARMRLGETLVDDVEDGRNLRDARESRSRGEEVVQ
jgi:hypothetical protein